MLSSTAAKKISGWLLPALLVGGGGGYPMSIIIQRESQAVYHLDLEYRRFVKFVNSELEENGWSFSYKRLDQSPTIFLDRKRRVVLHNDVNLPLEVRVRTIRFGDCSQQGVLNPRDVQFYYELTDGRNYYQKNVPEEFSGLFEKSGLCDYRPPEMVTN